MKKTVYAALVAAALLCMPMAYAEAPTDPGSLCKGLTTIQCDEVVAQANKLKAEAAAAAPAPVVQRVVEQASQGPGQFKEWVQAGAAIGAALGESLVTIATRLGIAVNEFAKSDVGQVAIWLIVWHVAGQALLSIGVGVSIFIMGNIILIYLLRRVMRAKYSVETTWSKEKTWYGRPIMEKKTETDSMSVEDKLITSFFGFIAWLVLVWITSAIIF